MNHTYVYEYNYIKNIFSIVFFITVLNINNLKFMCSMNKYQCFSLI